MSAAQAGPLPNLCIRPHHKGLLWHLESDDETVERLLGAVPCNVVTDVRGARRFITATLTFLQLRLLVSLIEANAIAKEDNS
jgi:hypothetical protein